MAETKYIFVTGGVASSLGKGIISASLGKLLQARGYSITIQKFDPYINIDSGTLNPYEHGECYVTVDGHEADLDLGHYERFTNIQTTKSNNITTGRIYKSVIEKERRGDYLGKTIQVIPHITDEITRNIKLLGTKHKYDFVITEIGGTVGDIESLPFIESIRQLKQKLGKKCICVHLTYVPYLAAAKELKTKPTQHSVKQLQEMGVQPDVLVLRTEHELDKGLKDKVALFCNVNPEHVIKSIDAKTIYQVPLQMLDEGLDKAVLKTAGLEIKDDLSLLAPWKKFVTNYLEAKETVKIGLVGKYIGHQDAYKSINEALIQASAHHNRKLVLEGILSENLTEENVAEKLKDVDAVLIAPGFGQRGVEGKFVAAKYARENDIPTLGICLGMQCMVIEYARNILNLPTANSIEMNPHTSDNVIDIMEEQKTVTEMGGTMRLGAFDCALKEGTKTAAVYDNKNMISERHRHRYEYNNAYKDRLEKAGMTCTGINPETNLTEIVEVKSHRWYIGSQFHPEYASTVLNPHPLFMGLVDAAIVYKKERNKKK